MCGKASEGRWDPVGEQKLKEPSTATGRIPGPSPGKQFLMCLHHTCSPESYLLFFLAYEQYEKGVKTLFSEGYLAPLEMPAFSRDDLGSLGLLCSVQRPRQQVNEGLINDLL